ncbi:hypothetical protein A2U01_0061144, partial [Trifolium medium]|nr:hypothetical protein [Trifolium medium]
VSLSLIGGCCFYHRSPPFHSVVLEVAVVTEVVTVVVEQVVNANKKCPVTKLGRFVKP